MSIGQWTVLPLHQTVREFLRQPENLTIIITAQISSKERWEPCGYGHLYILIACQTWFRLPNTQDAQIRMSSDEDIVMDVAYHSLLVERMAEGKRPYPWSEMQSNQLLDDIDARLCAHNHYKDCWPYQWVTNVHSVLIQKQWRFNFFAFAVLSNMPLLVGRRIRQGAVNVNRDYGLPLLFFSVICFDDGNRRTLRPAMTKLLLDHDADARQTCPNLEGFKKIDALAFLVYNCREYKGELDADDVEQVVEMLVQKGANPNGKLGDKLHYKWQWAEPRSEEPSLPAIAKLGLPRYNLFLILKVVDHTQGQSKRSRPAGEYASCNPFHPRRGFAH